MIRRGVSVISIKFIELLGNGLTPLLSPGLPGLSFGEKFSSEFSCICGLKRNKLKNEFCPYAYGKDYNYYNFL